MYMHLKMEWPVMCPLSNSLSLSHTHTHLPPLSTKHTCRYARDWRYHKEERLWITRAPGMKPNKQESSFEEGTYCYFDLTSCHWNFGPEKFGPPDQNFQR